MIDKLLQDKNISLAAINYGEWLRNLGVLAELQRLVIVFNCRLHSETVFICDVCMYRVRLSGKTHSSLKLYSYVMCVCPQYGYQARYTAL